jgi:hypothetical protein
MASCPGQGRIGGGGWPQPEGTTRRCSSRESCSPLLAASDVNFTDIHPHQVLQFLRKEEKENKIKTGRLVAQNVRKGLRNFPLLLGLGISHYCLPYAFPSQSTPPDPGHWAQCSAHISVPSTLFFLPRRRRLPPPCSTASSNSESPDSDSPDLRALVLMVLNKVDTVEQATSRISSTMGSVLERQACPVIASMFGDEYARPFMARSLEDLMSLLPQEVTVTTLERHVRQWPCL